MAFLNDITLGQYYPGSSFLHRLDPRCKLLTSLTLMTCLLVSTKPVLIIIQAVICSFGVASSRIPLRIFARNLKWFLLLFAITFGIHAMEIRVDPGWPYLAFSKAGLFTGLVYTSRLALLIILAALLTLTTVPIELTDGVEKLLSPLRRFKMPVHEFALMMTLALRFIPILIQEAERVKNAQLSRGASLQGSLVSRLGSVIPMAMPLFISAIRRADELAIAMAARHYTGGEGRTSYRRFVFERADYYVLLSSASLLLGIVMLHFVNAI